MYLTFVESFIIHTNISSKRVSEQKKTAKDGPQKLKYLKTIG